jgi:hypothetical protein
MASNERKTPNLQLPKPEIDARGTVRLGGGVIAADFPELRRPEPKIAARGTVRLGGGVISADFPS